MEFDDSTLVQESLNGNTDAFGALVKKYQSAAYGLAFHIVKNFADAQDLAQESFIEAYKNLEKLRDKSKFASWLKGITANVCKMWLRQQKEMMPIDKDEVAEMLETQHVPTPEEEYEAKEFRGAVMQAINSLPEKNRLVVTLYYLDGLSQKDIGDFLGVSVTAVETRLYRARKQLKEEMIKMVEQTFTEQKLSEDFTDKVIAELLAKPKPLEIPEHPLRKVWEDAQASLPDYTVVESGPEIESVQDNYSLMGDLLDKDKEVFYVDSERVLRVHTTTMLVNQLREYKPPIKLLTAGRVFRRCEEKATHYPIFHQIEGLCVGENITENHLKETIRRLVRGVLGDVEIRFRTHNFPFIVDPGWEVDVKTKGDWLAILGMGMFHKRILKEAGHDPETVSAFGFGIGIERLAMVKYEIDDIREFWRE